MSEIFLFVLGILVISYGYRLLEQHLKRRHEASNDAVQEAMLERCRKLEQRVRVLERIVTDKKSDLEREFESLRE